MITIEHVDTVTLQLGHGGSSILSEAILAGLAGLDARERLKAGTGAVQTSASGPPALGELWPGQGGRYGGTMPARADKPGYHLIVADGHADRLKWGPYDKDERGATDHWDGDGNCNALACGGATYPAAYWAGQVCADGHEDFYLPAHAELCQLWINVPQLFAKEGWYWSSTQVSPYGAWVQGFEYGRSSVTSKYTEFRAVAVRRLAL